MVNGKPNLTLGGTPAASPTATRQRAGKNSAGAANIGSFASYLPKQEYGKLPTNTAPSPAKNAALPAQPVTFQAPNTGNAKMYLGFMPDNYVSGPVQNYVNSATGQNSRQAVPLPAGTNYHAQARAQVRPGVDGLGNSMLQPQRVSAKSSPRISGQPVTGRSGIGMVDTRVTNSNRIARPGQNSQVFVGGSSRGTPLAPPGSDAYTRFTAYVGGQQAAPTSQSFLARGFSGKHAENAMKNLGYDMQRAPSITTRAQRLDADPYALAARNNAPAGPVFGITQPLLRPTGDEAVETAIRAASHRKKDVALAAESYPGKSLVQPFYLMADKGLGTLAAKFESGSEGIAAIGYDRTGGTSYGKYQIASRVGTMKSFINYLQDKAPDLAKRLEAAGPANTGNRSGRMPNEWRQIAAEDPQRFESLQSDFIRATHFEPALQAIAANTGVTFDSLPVALQEVLFSTAVQHGPVGATRIISQALNRVGPEKLQQNSANGTISKKAGEQLITQIYNLRAGQFMSSTAQVQAAARSRMKREMQDALAMLT